jgi:hypothetical protein
MRPDVKASLLAGSVFCAVSGVAFSLSIDIVMGDAL